MTYTISCRVTRDIDITRAMLRAVRQIVPVRTTNTRTRRIAREMPVNVIIIRDTISKAVGSIEPILSTYMSSLTITYIMTIDAVIPGNAMP